MIINNGCTKHMAPHNFEILYDLDTSIKMLVKMRNGEFVKLTKKDIVALQTRQGMKYIRDVLLCIISIIIFFIVHQMTLNGYSFYFDNDHNCYAIYDPCVKRSLLFFLENKTFPLN